MAIDRYWNILLKHWRLISLCIVVVGLGGYVGSRLMVPLYQSTVLVQISVHSNNNQADINSLLASDQLVQTEAQLALSGPVLREVDSHYPDLSIDQLTHNVSTVAKPNTQLFEIDVLDAHPQRAADLANDIAKSLIHQQAQLSQQDELQSQQQIEQDIQKTQAQIDVTNNQMAAAQASKSNASQTGTLQARLDDLQQHNKQWQTLLAQLELSEALGGNFMHVAQPAQAASSPVQPNILLNTAIGLLGGLLTGLLLTMLTEQLDTHVRSEEILTQLVNWTVLTTIWRQELSKKSKKEKRVGRHKKNNQALPIDEELINPPEHCPNVEAYRILRTNIGFSMLNKPIRSIVVVSATLRDGKSVVSSNLAIFMAKAGKKTLLIDADLRRPTLRKCFKLSADKMGLSNAVVEGYQQHLAISAATSSLAQSQDTRFSLYPYVHASGIPNLHIMPSGPLPPNPPELLDSKAMAHFFTLLEQSEFEMIIFDTPPLLFLSDASILTPNADSVLVVVDSTTASKKSVKQVERLLSQSGSDVLGCVINKQSLHHKDTLDAYSYYHPEAEEPLAVDDKKSVLASRRGKMNK